MILWYRSLQHLQAQGQKREVIQARTGRCAALGTQVRQHSDNASGGAKSVEMGQAGEEGAGGRARWMGKGESCPEPCVYIVLA